jgi:hypothetical protein
MGERNLSKSGTILVVVGVVLFVLGLIFTILNADTSVWYGVSLRFLIGVFVAVLGIAFIIVGGVTIIINRP